MKTKDHLFKVKPYSTMLVCQLCACSAMGQLISGPTGMTDPLGYTLYYEYDAFNRLKEVKDAEGNRVSDYDYSYMQPISN